MKKLLEILVAIAALASAVLGLVLLYQEKSKEEEYLTLYNDFPSDKEN